VVVGRAAPAGAGRAGAGRAGHRAQRVAQVAVLVALQQRLEQVQRRRRRRALPDKDENQNGAQMLGSHLRVTPGTSYWPGTVFAECSFSSECGRDWSIIHRPPFPASRVSQKQISSYRLPVFFLHSKSIFSENKKTDTIDPTAGPLDRPALEIRLNLKEK